MTAALSRYAESTPCGFFACVLRIIANSDFGCFWPSIDPVGVEDLVAAVLGVRLREHHELDVGGIALQRREVLHQVVDLVVRKRQAQFGVGRHQRLAAARQRHRAQRARGLVHEQPRRLGACRTARSRSCGRTAAQPARAVPRGDSARGVTNVQAMPRSMRRTASRPHTWAMSVALLDHGEMVPKRGTTMISAAPSARACTRGVARPIGQQPFEQCAFARVEIALEIDEVNEARADGADARDAASRGPGAAWRCGNRRLRGRRKARSFEAANCNAEDGAGTAIRHYFSGTSATMETPPKRRPPRFPEGAGCQPGTHPTPLGWPVRSGSHRHSAARH